MDNPNANNTSINNLKKNKKNNIKKISNTDKDNLKNLKKTIEKLKDDNLRYIAEIDNLRKRFEREKEDTFKYAITKFANEIIDVADNFERVIDNISAIDSAKNLKLKSLKEGVELIFKDFISTLERFEIKKIDALGKKFNPDFHQAVFEDKKTDKPEGEIVKIVQQGYTINERLLRPASVGISKGKLK